MVAKVWPQIGMRVGVFAVALFVLWPLVEASGGSEQTDHQRARDLFDEGVELARQKRWAEALSRLEASSALVERSTTIFNIGTVLLRLGRPMESIRAFERYLEIAATDDDEGRSAARTTIEEAHRLIARVDVFVDPADAEVRVDGVVIDGVGPERHLALDPGERSLDVRARNLATQERVLRLAPGDHAQVTVMLRPSVAQAHVEPLEPERASASRPVSSPEPVSGDEAGLAAEEADRGEGAGLFSSPYFWMLAGAIVAAAVVGVVIASGPQEPYSGTLDAVLVGLHER